MRAFRATPISPAGPWNIPGPAPFAGRTRFGRGAEEDDHGFREIHRARARVSSSPRRSLALREGHQQFTPEHLLKVLLDDEEGLAAGLIERAGGDPQAALARCRGGAQASMPKVRGGAGPALSGAGDWRASSTPPRRSPRRPATASSPSSGCCWRWRSRRTARPARRCKARRHGAGAERGDRRAAQGPHRRHRHRPRKPMTR